MDNTAPDTSPAELTRALVDLLTIEQLDTDLYRGSRQPGNPDGVHQAEC